MKQYLLHYCRNNLKKQVKYIDLDKSVQCLIPKSYPLIWKKMKMGNIDDFSAKSIIDNEINRTVHERSNYLQNSLHPKRHFAFTLFQQTSLNSQLLPKQPQNNETNWGAKENKKFKSFHLKGKKKMQFFIN